MNNIRPGIPLSDRHGSSIYPANHEFNREELSLLTEQEIRAIASDRGYELNDSVSRSRLRAEFSRLQSRDPLVSRV